MSALPKLLLWVSALTFTGFGLAFFVEPQKMAALVSLEASTDTARSEIRAMYGGLEIAFAIFLAWCAVSDERRRVGLVASGAVFAGIGAGRLGGILLAGGGEPILWQLLAAEVAAAGLSFWGAALAQRHSAASS